jgi:hypothetical protein
MQRLELFRNNLTGTIPDVFTLMPELQFVDIEENEMSGPAFVNLTGLFNLTTYRVSLNQFTGQIPQDGLSDLTSLREMWFAANLIKGTIPASISLIPSLGKRIMCFSFILGCIQ